MTLSMAEGDKYREGVSDWLAPVRALVKRVAEGLFAGALDLGKNRGDAQHAADAGPS